MALVEKYHVVAAVRPVNADATIKEGQVVALNGDGEVVLQGAGVPEAYGIAGDTKNTSASSMPGVSSGWQNRVSDYFDESKASSKMTVYHSGGEFATDMFSANVDGTPATQPWLYARNGYLDTLDQDGETVANVGCQVVAQLTQAAGSYPSGVPGVDVTGDMELAGANAAGYIEFKLMI